MGKYNLLLINAYEKGGDVMNEKELLNLSEDLNPITQRLVKYVTNICNIEKQKKALDEELKENLVLLKVDCQSYLDTLE